MTIRDSNSKFLTVLDPVPLDNIGWTLTALSERDYSTQIGKTRKFAGLGFTKEKNAEGGGKITLDADSAILRGPLPITESSTVLNQEALWQFVEDGVVRFEMLAEDVEEDVIPEGGGPRTTVITGRGTGMVLDWAKVIPQGMPTPTSLTRTFNAHPMNVWYTLFAEAQAAGYLTWVTPMFTATTDSAGNAWGVAQSVTVNAGDSLLDLMKRWCDANGLVWYMARGFRLVVLPSSGRRLEQQVVFTQYKGQESQSRTLTRRDIASDVYASSGDQGVALSFDAASRIKWKKRMAWVTAGDAADATGRSAVANATLSLTKDQKTSRTVKVPPKGPKRRIFVDYDVSDWVYVYVPADDTESGAREVLAATIDVNQDGKVDLELTTQSRFESRAEKVKRLLDSLGASSSGQSNGGASQIPTNVLLAAAKLSELSDVDATGVAAGDSLRWNGAKWVDYTPNLDSLADVDTTTTPPTHGQTMVYDALSGLWKPGAAGGGSGGGGIVEPATSPVTFVASADAFINNANTGSVTCPTVAAGDWIVLVVCHGYDVTAAPAGFSCWAKRSASGMSGWVFGKKATGSEGGTSLAFTFANTFQGEIGLIVVRNSDGPEQVRDAYLTTGGTFGSTVAHMATKNSMVIMASLARLASTNVSVALGTTRITRSADAVMSMKVNTLAVTGQTDLIRATFGGTTGAVNWFMASISMKPIAASDWVVPEPKTLLDIPPVSAHAKDDEFKRSALDPKWTVSPLGGLKPVYATVGGGRMSLRPLNGSFGANIRQTAPSGDFTIMAKLEPIVPYPIASDERPGLFVAQTSTSKALVWGFGLSGGPAPYMWIEHSNYSDTNDWGAYNGSWSNNLHGNTYAGGPIWFAMRYSGTAQTLFLSASRDGENWFEITSRGSWGQPDRIGIVQEMNGGGAGLVGAFTGVNAEWFRVVEP